MQKVLHTDVPRGQCAQGVLFDVVPDVGVRTHRQVHAPHEDRAVLPLETLIECEIVPDAAADPHQPVLFVRDGGLAAVRQRFYFLIEALRVRGGPLGTALPLGLHDGVDRVDDRHRDRAARGDQVAGLLIPGLLFIDQFHHALERVQIEHAAGLCLEKRDQPLQILDGEVQTVRVVELLPAVGREVEPVQRRLPGHRVFHHVKVGAVVSREELEDLRLAVAGQAGHGDRGVGQTAPGAERLSVFADRVVVRIKALRERSRAVAAQIVAVAGVAQETEIFAGHALRSADRGPPLVHHERNIHRPEDLQGNVRVQIPHVLAGGHAVAQPGEPLLLVGGGRGGRLQLFHGRRGGCRSLQCFFLCHISSPRLPCPPQTQPDALSSLPQTRRAVLPGLRSYRPAISSSRSRPF